MNPTFQHDLLEAEALKRSFQVASREFPLLNGVKGIIFQALIRHATSAPGCLETELLPLN